jgi:iron(III) transport system permease protein
MLRNRTAWLLFLLLTAILTVLFLLPVGLIIMGGFRVQGHWTLHYLLEVFRNPIYAEGLRNSCALAAGSTLLATGLAVPLAWLNHRYRFPGRALFGALLLVPMILPPFVGAIGLLQILGPYGALNALLGLGPVDWLGQSRFLGVITLQALALYPILYLNVAAALANIDPAMEEAAANLGSHGWSTFRRITLPLAMPGLFAGGTLVFIASFTELGTPLMLNYTRCSAVQVFDELKEISASPFPFALVTVVMVVSVLLYGVGRWLFGRSAYAMQAKATVAHATRELRGWHAALALLPFVVITLLALLPHAGVVLTSLAQPGAWYRTALPQVFTGANYENALGHAMTLNGIRNSLSFSAMALVLNLVLGLAIALVVVRSRLPVRGALDTLAMLPLAVPGLVLAFGFLALSHTLVNLAGVRAYPALAALLDVQTNPTLFLVMAYAIRRLPFLVRAAVAGLHQTSVTLEEAAANLGAPPLTVLRRITTPLIAANLIAGLLLVFAFSMLEVSDSLILAQKMEYYPITKTIFELFQLVGLGRYLAAALGTWAMAFLAVTIIGSSILLGKKLGALFRA